jgi:UDP-glucose 4-epimerase
MAAPLKYFGNNVGSVVALLEVMAEFGVKHIVFSSTAAVYGCAERVPISEDAPRSPLNPYGASKSMVEDILQWADVAHGIRHSVLRYFNAAGAHPSGAIGEAHAQETHLVPIIAQVLLGQRDKLTIYGDDYPTPDGTCIRDYIHVMDLAEAHEKALDAIKTRDESHILNLGTGRGYSVREVVAAFESVTGRSVPVTVGSRRDGDPAELIACGKKAQKILNWQPRFSELYDIVESAWRWHSKG